MYFGYNNAVDDISSHTNISIKQEESVKQVKSLKYIDF